MAADDTAVRRGARSRRIVGGTRAGIARLAGRSPLGGDAADRRIVRIEHVDVSAPEVWGGRIESGRNRQAQQTPVPEVVHFRAQIGHHGRRRGRQAVVFLDQSALFRDEDAAVGEESDGRRVVQAAEDDRFRETRLFVRGRRRRSCTQRQHDQGGKPPSDAGQRKRLQPTSLPGGPAQVGTPKFARRTSIGDSTMKIKKKLAARTGRRSSAPDAGLTGCGPESKPRGLAGASPARTSWSEKPPSAPACWAGSDNRAGERPGSRP